jgi:hypothetical protein
MDTADGKKRICALSFQASAVLMSIETCQIVGYETTVLVNGRPVGHQSLELDVFSSLTQFNRFAARYGHSFQGLDAHVRITMMRFVEQAKKKGEMRYIVKREGLDIVSIPHHENPAYHKPFLVWADSHNVLMQPDIAEEGLELSFVGFPDPRGVFRTDLAQAPALKTFLESPVNAKQLKDCLMNLMTCQRSELIAKYLGWYTSCFWRQLFHAAYGKFPLLHVNGAAGAGKTDMTVSIANLFYYRQEPKVTSPGSTLFSMQQYCSASSSLPLLIDEYKPHEMDGKVRNAMRAMFRDAYNQRDVARGGGTRESDDYRVLHTTQLSAPIVFIAEATEDEAAVMERVVLATVVRPAPQLALTYLHRFQAFRKDKHLLGILGQYLATDIVTESTIESFREEFDALYDTATKKFMINEDDLKGGVSEEELREKQNAKERSVFNHTVAMFGLKKLRALLKLALNDSDLDEKFKELEGGIYSRMGDLQSTTKPEVIRVLDTISSMTYSVDNDSQMAVRLGHEYAISEEQGYPEGILEIDVRTAYMRYRAYMKSAGSNPLFSDWNAFSYALSDSPAFLRRDVGSLGRPGTYLMDNQQLQRLGVDPFNPTAKK